MLSNGRLQTQGAPTAVEAVVAGLCARTQLKCTNGVITSGDTAPGAAISSNDASGPVKGTGKLVVNGTFDTSNTISGTYTLEVKGQAADGAATVEFSGGSKGRLLGPLEGQPKPFSATLTFSGDYNGTGTAHLADGSSQPVSDRGARTYVTVWDVSAYRPQ